MNDVQPSPRAQSVPRAPRPANAPSADPPPAPAAAITQLCKPVVTGNIIVVTAEQRRKAGDNALPPLTDMSNGFAWPDTELGVIKTGSTYAFFGSDGAFHARQDWEGLEEGNNKYGSVTRTLGTLDNPLGSESPIDVTIRPNPNPAVNPYYSSYDYLGGGPVIRVPAGKPGAGGLLMVYHAEIPTIATQSFYSVLALASSTDEGLTWTDLGEIVRTNQAYRTDMDGYDIGDPNLVLSPDGQYFYVYFADWLANGTTHWLTTINFLSVARAPVDSVLAAAFNTKHPHAFAFEKRYAGWNVDQGLGGYSRDLFPAGAGYWGPVRVNWNADLHRYQAFIDNGNLIAYAESPDGLSWSAPIVLKDFSNDPNHPGFYVTPIGLGDEPHVLGRQFYILYTYYPNNGEGWNGASVRRFTVTCR
ncbi:MAG TPA: hypothetical protein VIY53_21425 [Acidobacteriaceae bacterium]